MVNVSKKSFVRRSDLSKGDRITFLGEGGWQSKDFSKEQDGTNLKNVFIVNVSVNGDTAKELTLNATSNSSLCSKWGAETKMWLNKVAVVDFVKMVAFGELTDVLCLMPSDEVDINTKPAPDVDSYAKGLKSAEEWTE